MDKPSMSFSDLKKLYATTKIFQDKKVELCYSNDIIQVKSMKVKDKKEFLKCVELKDDEQIEKNIDVLIEKYCMDKNGEPINPKKLVENERQQLLVELRANSSDLSTVTIPHQCIKCQHIQEFPLKTDYIVVNNFKNPEGYDGFIDLAKDRIKVKLGQLNRQDNIDVGEYIKNAKLTNDHDTKIVFLAATLKEIYIQEDDVSIPVDLKIAEKVAFIENFNLNDLEKIETYFEKIEDYGIKIVLKEKCQKCGEDTQEDINVIRFFMN